MSFPAVKIMKLFLQCELQLGECCSVNFRLVMSLWDILEQGFPTARPRTGPWINWNRATQEIIHNFVVFNFLNLNDLLFLKNTSEKPVLSFSTQVDLSWGAAGYFLKIWPYTNKDTSSLTDQWWVCD